MGPLWVALLGFGRLAAACNSDSQCDFPYNNPFTTHPFWDTHTAATGLPPHPTPGLGPLAAPHGAHARPA